MSTKDNGTRTDGRAGEAPIGPETTVNELVRRMPSSLAVLGAVGIDTCCGGELPLGVVAERHGLNLGALLRELESEEAAAG